MKKCLAAAGVLACASAASAQVDVTFVFPNTGQTGLTFAQFTVDGVTITIENPRGSTLFPPDQFGFLLGGLFIDGGLSPIVDLTFSQSVRLVSYGIGNGETDFNGASFSMTQGASSSPGNANNALGIFAFSNTSSVFQGNLPIELRAADHDGEGFSISRITIRTIPAPGPLAMLGLGALAAPRRRR